MARTNKTKYAILGLLSLRPASGYDLKKVVDTSIGFFWNENYGAIYPILKRLEKEGLVTSRTRKSGVHPAKNVFTLTPAGEREFLSWLSEPPDEQPIRYEMLLKLFFGRKNDRRKVEAMIMAEKKMHQDLLAKYRRIEKNIPFAEVRDGAYWYFTLKFGIGRSEMVTAWCDETLKQLKQLP